MVIKTYKLSVGGLAQIMPNTMVFRFDKRRMAISTSDFAGGIAKVDGVFNQKLPKNILFGQDLPGGSVDAYLQGIAREQQLATASGLLTSARMECHGYALSQAKGAVVEVFATGGVEGNAARAGEVPLYEEQENAGSFTPIGGTINLLVFLSFSLTPGGLTRSLITLTEAKSALLNELGVFSTYGQHTATGTGTDGIIVVMNDEGPLYQDVGSHSQIGYLLADTAKQAMARTLCQECYWTSGAQLLANSLLTRKATTKEEKIYYLTEFKKLSFDEQQALTEGLSVWHVIEERYAWGGLSDKVYGWLSEQLCKRYPILLKWL